MDHRPPPVIALSSLHRLIPIPLFKLDIIKSSLTPSPWTGRYIYLPLLLATLKSVSPTPKALPSRQQPKALHARAAPPRDSARHPAQTLNPPRLCCSKGKRVPFKSPKTDHPCSRKASRDKAETHIYNTTGSPEPREASILLWQPLPLGYGGKLPITTRLPAKKEAERLLACKPGVILGPTCVNDNSRNDLPLLALDLYRNTKVQGTLWYISR